MCACEWSSTLVNEDESGIGICLRRFTAWWEGHQDKCGGPSRLGAVILWEPRLPLGGQHWPGSWRDSHESPSSSGWPGRPHEHTRSSGRADKTVATAREHGGSAREAGPPSWRRRRGGPVWEDRMCSRVRKVDMETRGGRNEHVDLGNLRRPLGGGHAFL